MGRLKALVLGIAVAPIAAAWDDEIASCVVRALPADTMVQRQTVRIEAEAGWSRESRRLVQWKRFSDTEIRTLLEVEAPKIEAGLKVLVIQSRGEAPVVWVYTPDTGRARRMVGAGASNSILGGALDIADAEQFERFASPNHARRLADTRFHGREVYLVEAGAAPPDGAYARIRAYIDKTWCTLLEMKFLDGDGAIVKSMRADLTSLEAHDDRWIPARLTVYDAVQGTRTTIELSDVVIDGELPDHRFSVQAIERGQ